MDLHDPEGRQDDDIIRRILASIDDIEDPKQRELVLSVLRGMEEPGGPPSTPAPGTGFSKAAGLLLRGATLGATGYPRPAEGIGESALEFIGSIPTIMAVGAVTSPAVAPALRLLRVPQAAMPLASRVAGAAATGGIVGGVEAGAKGEPVIPGAARGAGLFGATELGLVGAKPLLQKLRVPRVSEQTATKVPTVGEAPLKEPLAYNAEATGAAPIEAGFETIPGASPYIPPERRVLGVPRGPIPQGPVPPVPPEPVGIPQPGRVGQQPALPTRGVRAEVDFATAEGGPSVFPDEYRLPGELPPTVPRKATWERDIVPETPTVYPREYEIPTGTPFVPPNVPVGRVVSKELDQAIRMAAEAAKPKPALDPVVEEVVRSNPIIDIEASRAAKGPGAFASATEKEAQVLADNATKAIDTFLVEVRGRTPTEKKQTLERMLKNLREGKGVAGGVDLQPALDDPVDPGAFLSRFREYRDKVLSPLYQQAAGETMKKMGYFWPFRTQRGAFGDEFTARFLNKVATTNIQGENFVAQWTEEFWNALKPLKIPLRKRIWGLTKEQDDKLTMLLEKFDEGGKYVGEAGVFTEAEMQAGRNLRELYDRLFVLTGMPRYKYVNRYSPLIRQRPTGIVREMNPNMDEKQFIALLDPRQAQFVHELERTGHLQDAETAASKIYSKYIRAFANAKIRKPYFESIEDGVMEHFGARWVRLADGRPVIVAKDPVGYQMWNELKNHMMGGMTTTDITQGYSLQKFLNLYGKDADPRILQQFVGAVQSAYYAGAMGSPVGGRPSSIIRQFSQLVPTFAELGAKYTMAGFQHAFKPETIARYREMGLLSTPFEHALERVSMARGAGRAIGVVSETMLKVFSAVDQKLRVVTAAGSEARFNDYLARGEISKLPALKEMKEQIMRLVQEGRVAEARTQYMAHNVGNLQYFYGKANRPYVLRGPLGNLAGMFMSYPLNTLEMYRMFGKRAMQGDVGPLLRMITLSLGTIMAGAELVNADLSSAFFLGAMPYSLTFPAMAANMYTAGRSSAEALTKNLLSVGETQYHKKMREDAYRQSARDLKAFLPGGVFMFEDLPKLADERTVGQFFALTPRAATLDEIARERARMKRRERKFE